MLRSTPSMMPSQLSRRRTERLSVTDVRPAPCASTLRVPDLLARAVAVSVAEAAVAAASVAAEVVAEAVDAAVVAVAVSVAAAEVVVVLARPTAVVAQAFRVPRFPSTKLAN
jgi:hypothetical protein